MKAPAEKTPDARGQVAAHAAIRKHIGSNAAMSAQFIDNREEAADLRQLKEVVDYSPRGQGLTQLKAMMNNRSRSVAMQSLQAMVDNSPYQVVQRQQHSRVQSPSLGLQAGSDNVSVQRVEDEELLQGKFAAESTVQLAQQPEAKPNNTGLPDNLKSGIESLSGMSMDNVKVHYNSSEPAQLNAHAYAQGTDIHLGPGQEQHLPHEAWHVVQQAQGRVNPTMQRQEISINDDVGLEHEADVMGKRASVHQGRLDPSKSGVRTTEHVSQSLAPTGDGATAFSVFLHQQSSNIIQRVSMLVLPGTEEDIKDLEGNIKRSEEDLGLSAERLAGADLSKITIGDKLYLIGAHGNANSYGPYSHGKELSQVLFDRGLRQCQSILMTGCETGKGISGQLFTSLIDDHNVVIKDYLAAPKTLGIVREEGREVAYTEAGMQALEIEKQITAAFKEDPFSDLEPLFAKKKAIMKDKWELIENPGQLVRELDEQLKDLGRYYDAGGMDYRTYYDNFTKLQEVNKSRLKESFAVWSLHASEDYKKQFMEIINRKPNDAKSYSDQLSLIDF